MSYLDNGSTLRSMFRLMPPQRHDIDPTRSEVLAHIRENLACDVGRAIRAFNSMRNKKSQVLLYDMIHRQWRGCDWVPAEDGDQITFLTRTINEMKREMFALKSEVRKHARVIGQLERKRPSRRKQQEEVADDEVGDVDPEPKPEQQQAAPPEEKAADPEEWFRAMRVALYGSDTASPPSVAPQSSSSDSTFPIRSRWERAEG